MIFTRWLKFTTKWRSKARVVNAIPKSILKKKLIDHYSNHIHFCEHPGRPNLLCFKDMAAWVLEDFKNKSHQSAIDVITATAKIIKSDIREIPVDKFSLEDFNDTDYERNGYLRAYKYFLDIFFIQS